MNTVNQNADGAPLYPESEPFARIPQGPLTDETLLAKLKAMVADNLLSQAQVDFLNESPEDFIASMCTGMTLGETHAQARRIMRAIVVGYFSSLSAKANEGELFDGKRLEKELMRAQIIGVQAMAESLQENSVSVAQKIRIVELLKED